jgi:hypothetical protein
MKIDLPPDLEEIVKKQMADRQCDAVELIGVALHMLDDKADDDMFADWDMNVLRQEAHKGFDELDRKEYGDVTVESVLKRLQATKNA